MRQRLYTQMLKAIAICTIAVQCFAYPSEAQAQSVRDWHRTCYQAYGTSKYNELDCADIQLHQYCGYIIYDLSVTNPAIAQIKQSCEQQYAQHIEKTRRRDVDEDKVTMEYKGKVVNLFPRTDRNPCAFRGNRRYRHSQ